MEVERVLGEGRETSPRLYSRPIEGPRKNAGNTLSMCRDLPKSAISSSRASTAGLRPHELGGRVTQNQELPEARRMDTIDTKLKPLSIHSATGNTNPEQMFLPREPCTESQGRQCLRQSRERDVIGNVLLSFAQFEREVTGERIRQDWQPLHGIFHLQEATEIPLLCFATFHQEPCYETQWPDSFAGARD